jgi:hypothetical protein
MLYKFKTNKVFVIFMWITENVKKIQILEFGGKLMLHGDIILLIMCVQTF